MPLPRSLSRTLHTFFCPCSSHAPPSHNDPFRRHLLSLARSLAQLLSLFQILSIFNLNIDIVAPECLNPNITYVQKWFFIEALPILIVSVFIVLHVVKLLYKLACTTKRKEKLNAHLPALISSTITVFRLLFFYLTRTSMDVLACIPTTPPQFQDRSDPLNPKNPILYMAGQLKYRALLRCALCAACCALCAEV